MSKKLTIMEYLDKKIENEVFSIREEKKLDKKIEKMQQLKEKLIEIYEATILAEDEGRLNYSCPDEIKYIIYGLNSYSNDELLELRLNMLKMLSRDSIARAISLAQTHLDVHSEQGYLIDVSFDMNTNDKEESNKRMDDMMSIIHSFTDNGYPITVDNGYCPHSNKDSYVNIKELSDKRCPGIHIRFIGYGLLDKVLNKFKKEGFHIYTYCINMNKR